ncbi:hypothetical protein HYFRA_00011308 [Hymenoscyphus fraxineus]|uniref:ATP-dependent DNA helicase n=1 Tax=Hymenoscyphus fraxineus TaxID=746836 RepID=A0A9N9PTL2_9HELO|nr:hypothetical protein HYFRA_00011308 [Hymenoscyphus fraxineus]
MASIQMEGPLYDWAIFQQSSLPQRRSVDNTALFEELRPMLNADQESAFTTITSAIESDPQTAHFYLQGPGGTGKTHLYKTICYKYRADGKQVLCVASTSVAALLLPNGRTSHSQFKIPIVLNEDSTCAITKTSPLGKLLSSVHLIIWDEVPMQNKRCFLAVHRTMCDLRGETG